MKSISFILNGANLITWTQHSLMVSSPQAQRELDDYVESNEGMNREINNLKNKLR